MYSLTELKEFFDKHGIQTTEFNGWQLKVGKDTWTLFEDVFYLNNKPQSLKDKEFLKLYKKRKTNVKSSSTKTSKWRGISSRNYR